MANTDLAILVVDDVELGRNVIESALSKAGYTDIRTAASAPEALDLLGQRRADIVLADWIMPKMDGLQLTDHIRQHDEECNRYTFVILFTAKEGIEALVEAFERGVDDYLTKPLNEQELAARVHSGGRIVTLQNTLLETNRAMDEINRRLMEMAQTDPLTGLGNRRYLQDHLDAFIQETRSRGGSTCCALIDIDHFKSINDEHGHDVGDEVLHAFARRLRRTLRPTDIIARFGGEEFAVVMHYPNPDAFSASAFDRIRKSIHMRPFKTSIGDIPVTVSIGVCCYKGNGEPLAMDELLRRADRKLYEAKNDGRNRIAY
jgi:two-component system cell cycle response regulator